MRFHVFLAAALPFAAAGVVRRSAATILSAIDTIESNIATVNGTLNTFKQGSLFGIATVLTIQSQTAKLQDAVENATAVAKASKKLTKDGTTTVALAVLKLQPQISSLVDNLVAHKPAFDTVFLGIGSASPQVQKDLIAQQSASLALGKAITPKLSGAYATVAPTIIAQINATFTSAIAAFNNTDGRLPVPPIFPTV